VLAFHLKFKVYSANLSPGHYTFRFIACNAEGIWVEEQNACTLDIVIYPHWSDTWWFWSLLALAILGFVATATAFYYRYRLRAQRLANEKQQREAERQRLELGKNVPLADEQRKTAESEMKLLRSQLNPHFLFNAMNSVNRYILANDKADERLDSFAALEGQKAQVDITDLKDETGQSAGQVR
jgi:Histidine kinase